MTTAGMAFPPLLAGRRASVGSAPQPVTPAASRLGSRPSTLTLDGTLTRADYERLIERPFDVPAGITGVEVRLDYTGAGHRTVIDLGLPAPSGMRGWSGGRRTHVLVATLGVAGLSARRDRARRWAVLLGMPNIRHDTTDTYRVTVTLHRGAPLVSRPVLKATAGWYVGDLHAHSGHSDGWGRRGKGSAFPARRCACWTSPWPRRSTSHADRPQHGRALARRRSPMQPYYDTILLLHGREITTYRGHANAMGERAFTDFPLATPTTPLAPMLKRALPTAPFSDQPSAQARRRNLHGLRLERCRRRGHVARARNRSGEWGRPDSAGRTTGRYWAEQLNRGTGSRRSVA